MSLLAITVVLTSLMYYCEASTVIMKTDKGDIPEDVKVRKGGRTVLVTIGEVSKPNNFVSTVNLHDFEAGWVAMKSATAEMCLLKPRGKMQRSEIKAQLGKLPKYSETVVLPKPAKVYWRAMPNKLSYEEVVKLAGETLAKFCEDFDTYVLVKKEKGTAQGNQRQRRDVCILCRKCCNRFEAADIDEVDDIVIDFQKR